jgi:hypothetical protein
VRTRVWRIASNSSAPASASVTKMNQCATDDEDDEEVGVRHHGSIGEPHPEAVSDAGEAGSRGTGGDCVRHRETPRDAALNGAGSCGSDGGVTSPGSPSGHLADTESTGLASGRKPTRLAAGAEPAAEDLRGDREGWWLDRLADRMARLTGFDEPPHARRQPGPEANARITAAAAVVLLVLLVAEGITLASINRFVFWHLAIGIVLIPVVALKLSSVIWRFSRYYLGDRRYRAAGPPAMVLRVLGPVLALSTLALFATGIVLFVKGPGAPPLFYDLHKASFVLWIVVLAVHVACHAPRAFRLARRDLGRTEIRRLRHRLPRARTRQGLVAGSVVLGVGLLLASSALHGPWTSWIHHGFP